MRYATATIDGIGTLAAAMVLRRPSDLARAVLVVPRMQRCSHVYVQDRKSVV